MKIERPLLEVDDAAVERTLEILRKQRVSYAAVERSAREGDRLTVDFEGRIGGEVFQGGKAAGFAFLLGEKRMLPEFEANALGLKAGESKSFEVKFPEDYHGKDVAGKTAVFALEAKRVEEPRLPALDAEFARQLGVADGDLAKMRVEVRANVEREVKKRIEASLKSQALQALLDAAPLELPKALVQMEHQRLVEQAAAELQARGVKLERMPIDPQAFEATAKRRVALGADHRRARARGKTAAQARGSARADRGGVAELRASCRSGKMVLHAAAALVRNGEPGAREQRRQLGLVQGQGRGQGDCIRRTHGRQRMKSLPGNRTWNETRKAWA